MGPPKGPVLPLPEIPEPETSAFPTDPADALSSAAFVITETCYDLFVAGDILVPLARYQDRPEALKGLS